MLRTALNVTLQEFSLQVISLSPSHATTTAQNKCHYQTAPSSVITELR